MNERGPGNMENAHVQAEVLLCDGNRTDARQASRRELDRISDADRWRLAVGAAQDESR